MTQPQGKSDNMSRAQEVFEHASKMATYQMVYQLSRLVNKSKYFIKSYWIDHSITVEKYDTNMKPLMNEVNYSLNNDWMPTEKFRDIFLLLQDLFEGIYGDSEDTNNYSVHSDKIKKIDEAMSSLKI